MGGNRGGFNEFKEFEEELYVGGVVRRPQTFAPIVYVMVFV